MTTGRSRGNQTFLTPTQRLWLLPAIVIPPSNQNNKAHPHALHIGTVNLAQLHNSTMLQDTMMRHNPYDGYPNPFNVPTAN